jgi:hypothetical protein
MPFQIEEQNPKDKADAGRIHHSGRNSIQRSTKASVKAATIEYKKVPFQSLQNKPFWIWNVEQHKLDIRTDGDCRFNHIIGLPFMI